MNPLWIMLGKALTLLSYVILEYWLGKTKKVEANSILELALNLLSAILKYTGIIK